ncbi:radical SAM protein [Streptomyces avicenniae]|uniref:radical SAM protein n=1 Tax=Streptomyces avicenniae TaxID=500153 RepID=UPI00069B2C01|nr:hypothetical protein [Streptomyces avicenniae]
MRRLTYGETERLRAVPGATAVLFLTDRCPVGCGHCSVGSLPRSPTIRDWPLFGRLLAGLAALPSLRAVAVTGGEPFAERRGLRQAVGVLGDADKAVVVFTSGSWARRAVASWVREVLAATGTVWLSTDSFHAARPGMGRAAFDRAAGAVLEAGCRLVVQVLAEPGAAEAVRERWPDAEVSVVAPVRAGRGAGMFGPGARRPLDAFGPCRLLTAPTVRYDGVVTACCDEAVIMGAGPAALRARVDDGADVAAALAGFRADPVLRLIGTAGPVGLAGTVRDEQRSVCGACWAGARLAASDGRARAAYARRAAFVEAVGGP